MLPDLPKPFWRNCYLLAFEYSKAPRRRALIQGRVHIPTCTEPDCCFWSTKPQIVWTETTGIHGLEGLPLRSRHCPPSKTSFQSQRLGFFDRRHHAYPDEL